MELAEILDLISVDSLTIETVEVDLKPEGLGQLADFQIILYCGRWVGLITFGLFNGKLRGLKPEGRKSKNRNEVESL